MGNRYIVVGVDHYNPLGVIRSLGEADLPVEIILIGGKNGFVKTSKFSKDIYYVDNREEAYNALIEKLSQSMRIMFLCIRAKMKLQSFSKNIMSP